MTRVKSTWCERRDSNPHAFRRWNLNPVRLPIPPLSRSSELYPKTAPPGIRAAGARGDRYNRRKFKRFALPLPVDHYENFPVASLLLPARLRAARGGDLRLRARRRRHRRRGRLRRRRAPRSGWTRTRAALDEIEAGAHAGRARRSRALAARSRAHRLPVRAVPRPARRLLAGRRAARATRLRRACSTTAAAPPIRSGRLLLHLFGHDRTTASLRAVGRDLLGLQLINFWQDVARRLAQGPRLPAAGRAGALRRRRRRTIAARRRRRALARRSWRSSASARARCCSSGAPLGRALPGRIGLEIRVIVAGGARILDKIDAVAGRRVPASAGARRDWTAIAARLACDDPRPANRSRRLLDDTRRVLPAEGRAERLELLLQLPLPAAGAAPRDHRAVRLLPRGRRRRRRGARRRASRAPSSPGGAPRSPTSSRASRSTRSRARSRRSSRRTASTPQRLNEIIDGMEMDLDAPPLSRLRGAASSTATASPGVVGLLVGVDLRLHATRARSSTRRTSASPSSSPTSSATWARTRAATASTCRPTSSRASA